MKGFGWVLLVIGILAAFAAFNMDVSVATSYGNRVNNIGLMAQRQNFVLISCFIMLCGLLMVIFGGKKKPDNNYVISKDSIYIKCPYCAEEVHPEAIKCKHCGSDISTRTKDESNNSSTVISVSPSSLVIKLKDGYMIDESGVKSFIKEISRKYSDTHDLQLSAKDEIDRMMNAIPKEVHESYKRKVRQLIAELNK
ncbi:zinc ribbon domain-containing protein [Providencia vermicola]|uniref:zinc ribbon domain-containing protein n=1 Tax=Providencia vermicola TaxID=333965 RepID=UPI0034E51DE0